MRELNEFLSSKELIQSYSSRLFAHIDALNHTLLATVLLPGAEHPTRLRTRLGPDLESFVKPSFFVGGLTLSDVVEAEYEGCANCASDEDWWVTNASLFEERV